MHKQNKTKQVWNFKTNILNVIMWEILQESDPTWQCMMPKCWLVSFHIKVIVMQNVDLQQSVPFCFT